MSQIQTNQSAQIHKNSIIFAHFYQLLQKANDVIVICGPKQAGKSVTVDLLADKVLQNYEKQEDQKKYVAQQNNFDANYNKIYFQFLQKTNTLVLEGLTLDADKKKIKINLIKTFFIRTCLQAYKKIAFVIVVDQPKRQQIEQLDKQLQHFLQCLNIHKQIDTVKTISQNIYLLLAKTEDSNAIEQFLQNCQVLEQQAQHEGVKQILNSFREQKKVLMFPNDEPEANLGQKIRDEFATKIIQKAHLQNLNNNQIYPPFLRMLSNEEKEEVINIFDKLLKLLNALTYVLLQKGKNNITFENAKANLYQGYFGKQLSPQNLKKTSLEGLKKMNPKQRIKKESIQKQQSKKGYMLLIEYIQIVLRELQSKSTVKNNYDCIIGTLLFIKYLAPCLDGQFISHSMNKLINQICNLQILFGQNQTRQKQVSKPQISKKTVEKKGVNKAATIFKQQVIKLRNNQEFIKFTISKIKQKEVNDNFEPNDVIYHLKCLRELLQSYDIQQKSENRYFIQELLDIYAFNQNLYEFETNLKKYIQKKEISLSSIQKLIKKADQLKSYQNQVRLINYAIAHTFDDQQFRFLNRMKELVRIKQHQQYQARCENKELNNVQKKTYNLSVSFQAIKKKARSYWLNSQSFKKIIEAEE